MESEKLGVEDRRIVAAHIVCADRPHRRTESEVMLALTLFVLGNAGNDATYFLSAADAALLYTDTAPANHQAVFFTDRFDGSAYFHG